MKQHPNKIRKLSTAPPPLAKIDYTRVEATQEGDYWRDEEIDILEGNDPPPLSIQTPGMAPDPYLVAIHKLSESVQLIHKRLDMTSGPGPSTGSPMRSMRQETATQEMRSTITGQEEDYQSFVRRKLDEIQKDLKQMNKEIQEIKSNLKEINDHVAGNEIEILEHEEDVSEDVLPSPVKRRRGRTSATTTEEIIFPLTTEVCDSLEERLRAEDVDLRAFLEERFVAGRFRKESSLEKWFTVDVWDKYYAGSKPRTLGPKRMDIDDSLLFSMIYDSWSIEEYIDPELFRTMVFGTAKRVRARKYVLASKNKRR